MDLRNVYIRTRFGSFGYYCFIQVISFNAVYALVVSDNNSNSNSNSKSSSNSNTINISSVSSSYNTAITTSLKKG